MIKKILRIGKGVKIRQGPGEGHQAGRGSRDSFLSGRQIRRIVKRIRDEGNRGVIHKSRGRPSVK